MDRNYIPTKKKRIRYNFSGQSTESQPRKRTFSFFYQIATFPEKGKYHLRKYVFDDQFTFVNIEDYRLNDKDCKKFYSQNPTQKYKQYGVIDLNIVNKPSLYDLQTSLSSNLDARGSTSNLDSMYNSITGFETVDYAQLYRNNYANNVDKLNSISSHFNQNTITDFSSFE